MVWPPDRCYLPIPITKCLRKHLTKTCRVQNVRHSLPSSRSERRSIILSVLITNTIKKNIERSKFKVLSNKTVLPKQKMVTSTKVIFFMHFISNVICDIDLDVVNKNLFDSINFVNKKTDVVLTKLLSENKFNSDIIKSVGKNSDVVNNYEDITIMDDNGHLKNLKFKSALPKSQFDNLINSDVRLTKVSDKVTQIDRPVTESYDEDEVKFEAGGQKPKFFDELGRK